MVHPHTNISSPSPQPRKPLATLKPTSYGNDDAVSHNVSIMYEIIVSCCGCSTIAVFQSHHRTASFNLQDWRENVQPYCSARKNIRQVRSRRFTLLPYAAYWSRDLGMIWLRILDFPEIVPSRQSCPICSLGHFKSIQDFIMSPSIHSLFPSPGIWKYKMLGRFLIS